MLASVVEGAAKRFGSAPAVVDPDGTQLSYRDLDARSDTLAAGLARAGVRPGDVVALCLPSSSQYVIAYAGVAKAGGVAAGVNPRLTEAERAAALAVLEPRLVVGATGGDGSTRVLSFEELERREGTARPAAVGDDRPACIVLTSGTTGVPRGALFHQRQLRAIAAFDWTGRWGGGPPMLASTELAHVGFMTKLPWYLMAGGPIHLLGKWRATEALRAIAEQRIPVVGAIAPQIALMLRVPDFDAYDLSSVRMIVAGGAPSPPDLVHEARSRFGAGYSIRYSSTESGGVGTLTDPDGDGDEIATVGRPREGILLEVRDDEARPVRRGETGEVWLRSPAAMSAYWRDQAATRYALVDGWLRTGDVGGIDEAGRLVLSGRSSDGWIRGGYNVYPGEVEPVLAAHPAVADVAVVARPDPVMGEIGVAVVVPADPAAPPSLEELRAFAGTHLAAFKLPEALRVVDRLPLTSVHKVDRRALASQDALTA